MMSIANARRALAPFAALAVLVAAGACGSSATSSNTTTTSGSRSTSSTSPGTSPDSEEALFTFGEPADPSTATSTVDIRITGTAMAFDPSNVQTKVGGVVKFVVANDSDLEHEFVLGDEEAQTTHEEEMQAHGSHGGMADEANGFLLPPHSTKTLAWKFTEPATVIYGCHVIGHYAAGMKGTVVVTA